MKDKHSSANCALTYLGAPIALVLCFGFLAQSGSGSGFAAGLSAIMSASFMLDIFIIIICIHMSRRVRVSRTYFRNFRIIGNAVMISTLAIFVLSIEEPFIILLSSLGRILFVWPEVIGLIVFNLRAHIIRVYQFDDEAAEPETVTVDTPVTETKTENSKAGLILTIAYLSAAVLASILLSLFSFMFLLPLAVLAVGVVIIIIRNKKR